MKFNDNNKVQYSDDSLDVNAVFSLSYTTIYKYLHVNGVVLKSYNDILCHLF